MSECISELSECRESHQNFKSATSSEQDLIFLEAASLKFPRWVFNYELGDHCPFRQVPVRVIPPACIPPHAGRLPLAILVTGEPEPVLQSSLKKGIFLTVAQIRSILQALKIQEPAKGSGKGGRVVKLDLCTHLIETLFPLADEQTNAFMVASLMKRQTIKPEDAPELLLKLTSMLDCQEAQHFSKMRKSALDELSVAAMKARRKAAQEEDEARPRAAGVKRDLEKDEGASSSIKGKGTTHRVRCP